MALGVADPLTDPLTLELGDRSENGQNEFGDAVAGETALVSDPIRDARRGTAGAVGVTTLRPREAKCSWCGQDLQVRRGGSPQRFCSTEHRSLFWSNLRRWGDRAVAAGILTISDIRNGDPAACTLPGTPVSPPPASAEGQDCISDDFGRLLDEMDGILGEPTIPLLIRLRWLQRERQKDHAAVVHALCSFFGHVLSMTRNGRP
jgi:hypothetical protein